ncbi:MAG: polysaccharide deacetylase family protein, partial [Chloroflexi bacterium]|nr:polysaccharide deacetylase family protein [Chloroflexota bacterium]
MWTGIHPFPKLMKNIAKMFLRSVFKLIPLWMYRRLFPRELTAFFYHAVSDEAMPHVKHLYPQMPVERFENALIYLRRHFNPVSYTEAHAHVVNGASLPARAVHLSFDDGYGECYTVVRPLLLKYEIQCTFFVATDWIDNQAMFYRNKVSVCIESLRGLEKDAKTMLLNSLTNVLDRTLRSAGDFEDWMRSLAHADQAVIDMTCRMLGIDIPAYLEEHTLYLTAEQIQQMAADGFTIGSHTRSHPKLGQVSAGEMEAEIVESARVVQTMTGAEMIPFSFPNSAFGIERAVLADIRRRNPMLGLFFATRGLQKDEDFIVDRI